MEKIALFPGSFDPFTKGHEDILLRGLQLFDKIIIAIGYNTSKHQRYFDVDTMVRYIEEAYEGRPEISVLIYNELTADEKEVLEEFTAIKRKGDSLWGI